MLILDVSLLWLSGRESGLVTWRSLGHWKGSERELGRETTRERGGRREEGNLLSPSLPPRTLALPNSPFPFPLLTPATQAASPPLVSRFAQNAAFASRGSQGAVYAGYLLRIFDFFFLRSRLCHLLKNHLSQNCKRMSSTLIGKKYYILKVSFKGRDQGRSSNRSLMHSLLLQKRASLLDNHLVFPWAGASLWKEYRLQLQLLSLLSGHRWF